MTATICCCLKWCFKVETKELLPLAETIMTQQLPYNYEANAKCYEIINWFKHIQRNDDDRVQVLRAWLSHTFGAI